MSGFIKQTFIVLVPVLLYFGGSLALPNAMKCLSMNNQPYPVRPTLINMNLDELHHCPFIISMNRFDGSCNTIKNPFEGVNLKSFSMMKGINESMTLAKHVSWECRCDLDDKKCNSRQKRNNDKCQCEHKATARHRTGEEDYAWNRITCTCELDMYCYFKCM